MAEASLQSALVRHWPQLPAMHTGLSVGQTFAQTPQLRGSVLESVQTPPQAASPCAQQVLLLQLPDWQSADVPQARPLAQAGQGPPQSTSLSPRLRRPSVQCDAQAPETQTWPAGQRPRGSAPAASGEQEPTCSTSLQLWHADAQSALQQTPSRQKPEAHWMSSEQGEARDNAAQRPSSPQRPPRQSAPNRHLSPTAHGGQSGPPQSTPVSAPLRTPSLQVALVQRPS
jgi:hypothetical protein